jgi:hypothetical protein
MKKYKLLKDIYDHKMFSVFDEEWYYHLKQDWKLIKSGYQSKIIKDIIESKNEENYFVKFQEYFEEIIDKPKPKYKVWDYVVEEKEYNNLWNDEYIKIFSCQLHGWKFIYNTFYMTWWTWCNFLREDQLRFPNSEEIETYFR